MQGEIEWSPLFVQGPDDGPLGPDAMLMLHLEAELTSNGIEVAFDPLRPGEYFPTKGWLRPVTLLVMTRDLARARDIVSDVRALGGGDAPDEQMDRDTAGPPREQPLFASDARPTREASGPPKMPPAIQPGCLVGLLTLAAAAWLARHWA